MKSNSVGAHAVVMGSSMAGLLTARVLSEHFDRVTLVERDAVHSEPESRKGQPQTRHLHALLASGLAIMTRYYPDLPDALVAGGALGQDVGETMQWYTCGGYRRRFRMGTRGALVTRPFLESLIRQRTLARANITLLDESASTGLLTSADHQRVTGVRVERRSAENRQEEVAADLVVDCTGRGSRSPQWLAGLGYAAPSESEVKVDVGYASRTYRRAPADPHARDWNLYSPEAPAETRFGGMFPVEGDRWMVSMGGGPATARSQYGESRLSRCATARSAGRHSSGTWRACYATSACCRNCDPRRQGRSATQFGAKNQSNFRR